MDEDNKPDYGCFYDTSIYKVNFTNSVLLVNVKSTAATMSTEWMDELLNDIDLDFVLAIPLDRVIKINVIERTE